MKRFFLALVFFIGFFSLARAQTEECTANLARAEAEFESGHIEAIANILHDCLDKFSKEQQVQAYRLLSITYLYLDDPIGAENSYLALLAVEPQFIPGENDPIELVYLSKQYITTPIISYFAKGGANFSHATVLHRNPIGNESDTDSYNFGGGFSVSGGMDLHFNKVVSLAFELEYSARSITKTFILFPTTEFQTIKSKRKTSHFSVPVAIKFTYPKWPKYQPYIYGGYSPSYTLGATADDTRTPEKEAVHEVLGLNLKKQVVDFSHSLIFGAGLKTRVGKRFGYKYAIFDVRYRAGMTNMTNADYQYDFNKPENSRHIFTQLNGDDDFRWNGVEITLGFVWPIYKPREKNSVTIQTTLKRWFGKKSKNDE